jgi:hypothetical protein
MSRVCEIEDAKSRFNAEETERRRTERISGG